MMPKNKKQGILYGLMMALFMTFGMEIYNVGIRNGLHALPGSFSNMTNAMFLEVLHDFSFMWLFAYVYSILFGNKVGNFVKQKYTDPEKNGMWISQFIGEAGTTLVMCPAMSFTAALLFFVILGDTPLYELPATFIGTAYKNFPYAFFLSLFVANPLAQFFTKHVFYKV